jgi:hypothetical protein
LAAGLYPAIIVMSGFEPAKVLKGEVCHPAFRVRSACAQALLVVQLSASIGIIIFCQASYFNSFLSSRIKF